MAHMHSLRPDTPQDAAALLPSGPKIEIEEITHTADFGSIWPVLLAGYRSSPQPLNQPFFDYIYPLSITDTALLEQYKRQQMCSWLLSRNYAESKWNTHWIRAVDANDPNRTVIGVACWQVHRYGSLVHMPQANWLDEGSEERQFADMLLEKGSKAYVWRRIRYMLAKGVDKVYRTSIIPPAFQLNAKQLNTFGSAVLTHIAVHPNYMRNKVGSALVRWGTLKSDSSPKSECMAACPPYLSSFFRRCGFWGVKQIDPDMTVEAPSDR